jgi:hypothetical protein
MNYGEVSVAVCAGQSKGFTKSGRRPSLSTTLVATSAEIQPFVPQMLDSDVS